MTFPDSFAPPVRPVSFAHDAPFSESYEIVREVGRGGMAIVYLVRDRATGEQRAVKVIHTKYLGDEEAVARFDREARLLARLEHPNIVATHSVRWIDGIGLGLVMDHVEGRTLKQILKDGEPISFERATSILNDIASALGYAHVHGIVHRDVKPENIFIDDQTGRAVLADFGIARSVQGETQLTLAGVAIGTPTYMAPEQIEGGAIDARSDLYSLGLVGWEMLTGRRPWDGETLYNVIYHQKHDQLPAIDALRPDTPPRLVYAIEGLLEKSPATRWQTAAQFQEELTSTGPPIPRTRDVTPSPDETVAIAIPTAAKRRSVAARWIAAACAVAVLAAAVLLLVWPAPVWGPLAHTPAVAAPRVAHAPAGVTPASPTLTTNSIASEMGALGAPGVPVDSAAAGGSVPAESTAVLALPPAATGTAFGRGDTALVRSQKTGRREARVVTAPIVAAPPAPAAAPPAAVTAVTPLRTSFTIAAGGAHTCMIAGDGTTYCWGANTAGQLGTGTTETVSRPAAVAGSARFASISAGLAHTCARTGGGLVYCWGNNDHGQIGDGTTQSRDVPTKVAITRALSAIASGSGFTCGLATDGLAYCWGAGSRGQIGDGASGDRTSPSRVAGGISFTALAAGWNHVCGLDGSGVAYCWGANDAGQLGDGSTTDRAVPTAVRTDLRFTTLSAGSSHTCGTTSGGSIYCWGANKYGQLGDGSRSAHLTPVAVTSNQRFISVSAGSVHTCALSQSHEAWCWGRNTYGQLGDGTDTSRPAPVRVSGGQTFTVVKAFGSHTCGTASSGDLFCWGYNLDGQLGDGTREHRLRPTYIERPTS